MWVSITGYGYYTPRRDRVAFGDDAAVAGGAAVAAGGPDAPVFVLDAVADPLSGLVAAAAVTRQLRAARAAFVDVCMAGVVNASLATGFLGPGELGPGELGPGELGPGVARPQ